MPRPKPTPCPSVLQFACGIQAEVVGKPAPEFFKSALREMGLEAHEVGRPQQLCREARGLTGPPRVGGLRRPCRPRVDPPPRGPIWLERGKKTAKEAHGVI